MGQLPKNERGAEPIPGSPISQEEDKLKQNTKKNDTKSHTLLFISHY